jgi:glycosyltransferase involved in cell wall biosynthesis
MNRLEAGRTKSSERALVTVGVPVFNGARFLERAIDSLLAQTYRDIDVVISDNASTDATPEICQRYVRSDPRVRYVRQPQNIGAPRNWNFVANQAHGAYFKWASANDYCDPRLIAACLEVLDSRPDVVLCYGRTYIVGDDERAVVAYKNDFALDDERPSDRFRQLMSAMRLNNAVSGLVRTDALRRTGLIRLYPTGDMPLMVELALQGKFHLVDGDPLLYRRITRGTFSGAMSASELREFLTPGAKGQDGNEAAMHWDCAAAVLRAPIAPIEKLRSLQIVARSAYWGAHRAIYGWSGKVGPS